MASITSHSVVIHIALDEHALTIRLSGNADAGALFVALDTDPLAGCAVVPFGCGAEGSTVFLPMRADVLFAAAHSEGAVKMWRRTQRRTHWSEPEDAGAEFAAAFENGEWRCAIRREAFGGAEKIRVIVYAKDLSANDGWGRMIADARFGAKSGEGDQFVSRCEEIDLTRSGEIAPAPQICERVRIYQLLPRLFGNTNATRKPNGTLAENGVGKFDDINETAIASLSAMGFTHVWLAGVLQQATGTDYSALGEPADTPALLKGIAGSPYAIRDCFDLCPDYATNPAERFAEFRSLFARLHAGGLRAIIDFVPNHVARSHRSSVMPELSFGAHDDRTKFFDPRNNFFWLQRDSPGGGPPMRLPTSQNADAISDPERECGRATGNNVASWQPTIHDWYETVKLNYGFDFTTDHRAYPHAAAPDAPLPDTWVKMDRVLAFWQEQGVDGFRCDMAHMVPPEFWTWAVARARARQPGVFFAAEAYDNDPAKVPAADPLLAALNGHRGHVMIDLLAAGFDAVYDDPSYKTLKAIYEGGAWANDLVGAQSCDFIFQNALRYAENHDEVRLAGRGQWGGGGMTVGRPVSAILFGMSRGPVLLYHGQEVGEPADGAEGFGGDDARTTIFDYWSMPELAKWVNGHRYDGALLSPEQRELRAFYSRLLRLAGEPAFREGEFFALNPANIPNENFGRLPGETASGHWLFAFLRADPRGGQRFLVIANLHPSETLRAVGVHLPADALTFLGLPSDARPSLIERLSPNVRAPIIPDDLASISIGNIAPLTALYFELHLPGTTRYTAIP